MKDNIVKSKFIELRSIGLSLRNIADRIHVSRSTLAEWDKDLTLQVEIAKRDELDNLKEQYQLNLTSRIKRLGILLNKIEQELSNREFSDIPTDKLLAMYLSYIEGISKHEKLYSNDDLNKQLDAALFLDSDSVKLLDSSE